MSKLLLSLSIIAGVMFVAVSPALATPPNCSTGSNARQYNTGKLIGESIALLPEREKLVITLYYYEELTLREIGDVLGVTESRVSQLHTKAILRMKARLASASARATLND